MSPDKRWKAHERNWAVKVHSTRTGPLGRNGPDVITSWAAYQIKSYVRVFWSEVKAAVTQAQKDAKPLDLLPFAVIYEKGSRDPWIVMRGSDFLSWTGLDMVIPEEPTEMVDVD